MNDTVFVPKIPPLSILLNSSFYILGPDDFPVRRTADDVSLSFNNTTGDMAINDTISVTEREDWTSTTINPILMPINDSITTPAVITAGYNSSNDLVTSANPVSSISEEESELVTESASGT
jgi:hypothetical protein